MLVLVSVKGIDFREELFRLQRVTLENYGGMLRYRGGGGLYIVCICICICYLHAWFQQRRRKNTEKKKYAYKSQFIVLGKINNFSFSIQIKTLNWFQSSVLEFFVLLWNVKNKITSQKKNNSKYGIQLKYVHFNCFIR